MGDHTTEIGGNYNGPILNLWNSDTDSTSPRAVGLTASIGLPYTLPPAGWSAAVFARNGRGSRSSEYTVGVLGEVPASIGDGSHIGVVGDASGGTAGSRIGVLARSSDTGVSTSGDNVGLFASSNGPEGRGILAGGHAVAIEAVSSGGVAVRATSPQGTALEVVGKSTFSALLTSTAGASFDGLVTASTFSGDGAGLTDVTPAAHNHNASDINAGTLADARLTRNIPRRNAKVVPFAGTIRAGQFSGPQGKPPAFSSLGTAQVPAGAKEVRIRARGIGPGAHVLALFQSNPGAGVMLAHVVKGRGSFRAVLNKAATRQATLAFFVMRSP
jgi:hypothetical protein